MSHLDICIDLETCGLGTNAAPMQLAAVAFDRTQFVESSDDDPAHRVIDNHPFLYSDDGIICRGSFLNVGFDLRDCFFHGLQFEAGTQQWWLRQSADARQAVLSTDVGPYTMRLALSVFSDWLTGRAAAADVQLSDITIWAQGSDFDIAKLREYYSRCGMTEPFRHTQVRCARTYILENACLFIEPDAALRDPKKVYSSLVDLPGNICPSVTHDALYDSFKTAWQVWQVYQKLMSSLSCVHES